MFEEMRSLNFNQLSSQRARKPKPLDYEDMFLLFIHERDKQTQ